MSIHPKYRVKTINEIEEGKVLVSTVGEFKDLYSANIFKNAVEKEMYSALGYVSSPLLHEVRILEVIETEREVSDDELSDFNKKEPDIPSFDDPYSDPPFDL